MPQKLTPVPPDTELDSKLEAMEDAAESDLSARPPDEARVNFRWGREQLAIVKRAAAVMGVPYQTYMKQVVFRQALADLQAVRSAR